MTDILILYKLQKIHEAIAATKEEHTLKFSMIESTVGFSFSEPILNTTKFGISKIISLQLSFYCK